jgi:CRISPR/Cas system-associated exonuclease Cas4 (RecB family)
MTGKITAWSFSRLKEWRKCALKAKFKFVDKMKEPMNNAMQKGTRIDEVATAFMEKPARAKVPKELFVFKEELVTFKKEGTILTQQEWAVNEAWEPTGWFDRDAWLRVKPDFNVLYVKQAHAITADFKTGRVYVDHEDQMELQALMALIQMMDGIQTVSTKLIYLDNPTEGFDPRDYHQSDVKRLKRHWVKESKPMLTDKSFKATPGNHCRWCHFRKSNGGPCKF